MTINDQIKDGKLQYDINREAAKISALSSGKLHKYEYLTGGDILPSNQQQIIEQAKFTYSLLGKAFEKQTKTIEDHGKKQVEALENLKPLEGSKAVKYDGESLEQKQKTYSKLFDMKLDEIQELCSEIDYKNLNYDFRMKASGSINFTGYNGPFTLFKKIRDGDISLEMVEEDQKKFKREFGQIKSGNPDHKSDESYISKKMLKISDKGKKLLIYFIATQKLDLKPFTNQNKMGLREKDLKH